MHLTKRVESKLKTKPMGNNKRLEFLSSFSKKEWLLNGHKKEDIKFLLKIYNSLLPHIKGGRYLELGCGTGILCKFISLFSRKKIIPYGVDKNPEAISFARKNNLKFMNNFIVANYFRLSPVELTGFQTIVIFVGKREIPKISSYLFPCAKKISGWSKLNELINFVIKNNKDYYIVFFSYDDDLINIKNQKFIQFEEDVKKVTKISLINKNLFVIEKND